jgi:hypothetical protein
MEQTECSETQAYKIQTPGNCSEESIQHSEHGKSLKSTTQHIYFLPVLPLQVFYVFVALFLVYVDSFGIFNFSFFSP